MKIKVTEKSYGEVLGLQKEKRDKPKKPNLFFRTLLKVVCSPELKQVGFTYTENGMERLGKKEPCLFLMNHSSFIDLKIAESVLYPRPLSIVCTSDGFVGKKSLMRNIGCIPAQKFVTDFPLVKDMIYTLKMLGSSVLMYPEASYSFDGTATVLPDTLGKLIKKLSVPVVMITTSGAFARDPLYNGLQLRDVKVSAEFEYLFSPDEIKELSEDKINLVLKDRFSFDYFKWQKEKGLKITEPFRADHLERVLYKCRECGAEGAMLGEGTALTCTECGKKWTLNEYGEVESESETLSIPSWSRWQRECVKQEIESGSYLLDTDVDIFVLKGTKSIYKVGEGKLKHDSEGFSLVGCEGELCYTQKPLASYSLYSDFYWYEIGDMICIGNGEMLYYCFPKDKKVSVAKARTAAEELYKVAKEEKSEAKVGI